MEVEKCTLSQVNTKTPSKIKTMLITFFDTKGIIYKEFVPSGQTVTAEYCVDVLKCLMARILKSKEFVSFA